MKLTLSAIENMDQDDQRTRRLVKIFYIVLYPILMGWNVLGTFMFMDINSEEKYCVKISFIQDIDDRHWMIILWLIVGYFFTLNYLIISLSLLIEWIASRRYKSGLAERLVDSGKLY
jgi:hypothetical protein